MAYLLTGVLMLVSNYRALREVLLVVTGAVPIPLWVAEAVVYSLTILLWPAYLYRKLFPGSPNSAK